LTVWKKILALVGPGYAGFAAYGVAVRCRTTLDGFSFRQAGKPDLQKRSAIE
jgi:hypothetical protein